MRPLRFPFIALLVLLPLVVSGWTTARSEETVSDPARPGLAQLHGAARRSAEYIVLIAEPGDSYDSLALGYLGDARLSYLIADANDGAPIAAGKRVVIPLRPANAGGVYQGGYQTVPILCYHQFTKKKSLSRMCISEELFDRQMAYLKKNGYHVITMAELFEFLGHRRSLPAKSVVITIDDGWKTTKTIAYPILKKYGFTAVLFVYTDNIKDEADPLALTWGELRELRQYGFEIQSHGVTHGNLGKMGRDQQLAELRESRRIISEKLGVDCNVVAYPYGVFDEDTIKAMTQYGYKGGVTVMRGGNPFFSNTFSLNRSMVYNSDKLDDFKRILETFKQE